MPKAPAWLKVVEVAQSMDVKPWKLIGGTKTLWYARFEAIRDSQIRAQNKARREMEALEDKLRNR